MDFNNKMINWDNAGSEPSDNLKTNGFQAGNKPPANVWNFIIHLFSNAIKELQDALSAQVGAIYNEMKTHAKAYNAGYGGFEGGINATAQSGAAIGEEAQATSGGAVGARTKATAGGGAIGNDASANYGLAGGNGATATSGGAVGQGTKETNGGFAGGQQAQTTSGGAVGNNAVSGKGFAGGSSAKTVDASGNPIDAVQLGEGTNNTAKTVQAYDYPLMDANGKIPQERLSTQYGGFAHGENASTSQGAAIGNNANAGTGAAIGYGAKATSGGAVGYGAMATSGFSGGFKARAIRYDENQNAIHIDAVQLGEGTNQEEKTLQVYNYKLMNADGTIPAERMDAHMIIDSYVGDGTDTNTRFANLGYKPKKIEIVPATVGNYSVTTLIQGCPYSSIMRSANDDYGIALEWTDNGVTMTLGATEIGSGISKSTVVCNFLDTTYHYIIHR